MPDEKLNELQIKAKVLTDLRQRGLISKDSIIANEFRLGRSSLRADLAILADEFIGIEIKSERDSLRRLPSQLDGYVSYFDRVVVVLASKHLLRLDIANVAPNVELCEVDARGDLRSFKPPSKICRARKSPLQLLTQEEQRKFSLTLAPHNRAVEETREKLEREFFRTAFTKRFEKTSEQFWKAVGRKRISPSDLTHLSRFFDRRQRLRKFTAGQAQKWEDWHVMAEFHFSKSQAEF